MFNVETMKFICSDEKGLASSQQIFDKYLKQISDIDEYR